MATHSVDVRELIRKTRQEAWIEDRLVQHPYLISPELKRPVRQLSISRTSRLDLLFKTKTHTVIVEIKRGKVTTAAFEQLLRYQREMKLTNSAFRGYLIGRDVAGEVLSLMKKSKMNITYLGIGREIPECIAICWKCRKARSSHLARCPFDGETRII